MDRIATRWNSEVPLSEEAEGRRQKASAQVPGSLGNGSSMGVSDCRRWKLLGVGCGRLDVPMRHPAEMSSGEWGGSGVQTKTG